MKKRINIPIWYKNNRLKELRKKFGYTQEYVSLSINCVLKTYQNYEQGHNFPTLEYIDALSTLYSVSIDYLLGKSSYTDVANNLIGDYTGLSDDSIQTLCWLKQHQTPIPTLQTLNILMHNKELFEALLCNLDIMLTTDSWNPALAYTNSPSPLGTVQSQALSSNECLAFVKHDCVLQKNIGILKIDSSLLKSHAHLVIKEILDKYSK